MNQIRFSAFDGEERVARTDWIPEAKSTDAPNALETFRKHLNGDFQYRIERTGDTKRPNKPELFRYRIKVQENVYYSRVLYEVEKETALREIREMFPKAEVVEEKLQ